MESYIIQYWLKVLIQPKGHFEAVGYGAIKLFTFNLKEQSTPVRADYVTAYISCINNELVRRGLALSLGSSKLLDSIYE